MIDKLVEEIKAMISEEIDDSTILGASMIDSIYERIDEIAGEHKTDKCKWKYIDANCFHAKIPCKAQRNIRNIKSMRNYKYCPYCGKEIDCDD